MKLVRFLLASSVALSLPAAAAPTAEEAWEACRNEQGKLPLVPDEIKGCEAVIASASATTEMKAIAHTNRGMIMAQANFFETAKSEFDWAIALDPTLAGAYYNRAILSSDVMREFAAAKADLDKAVQLDPKFADAFLQRGVVNATAGDFKAAVADFDQVIRLQPSDALAYLNRGHAKLELGQKAEGEADIAKAKAIDPKIAE